MYLIENGECASCGKSIKFITPELYEYYFCDKTVCKIKVLVEMRAVNPMPYGVTEADLKRHYGDSWKNILSHTVS